MNQSKFQFSDPELEKIEFNVNSEFEENSFEGITMESITEVKTLELYKAKVFLTLKVGDGQENEPFHIVVKMSAEFFWNEGMDQDRVRRLLKANAPAVLLSYIRPIVSSLTTQSKYPALNIPFIDFSRNEIIEL